MRFINTNLITLKCVLFLFFGGIGSLYPFIPRHITQIGLTVYEFKLILIVAPCVALFGPAIAGPLADRLSGGFSGSVRSKTGTYLRVLTAVCLLLAAFVYAFLLAIPPPIVNPPSVTFMCDPEGAFVLQQRYGDKQSCYNFDSYTKGSLLITNCKFTCNTSLEWTNEITTIYPDQDTSASADDYDFDYKESSIINSGDGPEPEVVFDETPNNENSGNHTLLDSLVPHPHICYERRYDNLSVCEVYTKYSKPINLTVGLLSSIHDEEGDQPNAGEICTYPLVERFHCRITPEVEKNLTKSGPFDCRPIVKCGIHNPYNETILRRTAYYTNDISFWLYLTIRSIGDFFVASAVALLGAAVVIATRETSTGRGDVGKQFAFGALGLAVFAPIVGGPAEGNIVFAVSLFVILFVFAALILLFDYKMPLSPPEWWWHTRCGLLALPMSAVRKYGLETAALGVILFLLGIFWSALDSYIPWRIEELEGHPLITGLAITVGSLPAIPFLIFAEKIIDYCGHSNILIVCFVNYICHYLAVGTIKDAWIILICEALEIFTLHLMWITAVLYLRHLVPRKFTASGQALPVIVHFCLARIVGSIIGGIAYSGNPNFSEVHNWFSVSAAIVAVIYFLLYHFYLKPRCAAPTQQPPRPAPAIVQSMNGNGSYTPLRVYHNGLAKKGQFRY